MISREDLRNRPERDREIEALQRANAERFWTDARTGVRIEQHTGYVSVTWPSTRDLSWFREVALHAVELTNDDEVALTVDARPPSEPCVAHGSRLVDQLLRECSTNEGDAALVRVDLPGHYLCWMGEYPFRPDEHGIGIVASSAEQLTYLPRILEDSLPSEPTRDVDDLVNRARIALDRALN